MKKINLLIILQLFAAQHAIAAEEPDSLKVTNNITAERVDTEKTYDHTSVKPETTPQTAPAQLPNATLLGEANETKPVTLSTDKAPDKATTEVTAEQAAAVNNDGKNAHFIEALASVYRTNPQLKAERENLKAIDEGIAKAVSGFRPDVQAGYVKGRRRSSIGNDPWDYGDVDDKNLSITQPIFNGGSTVAEYKAASDRVHAGRARLTAVEQQVLYDAIVAYCDIIQKQSVLELNQHNVEVLGKQGDATNQRFDAGDVTRTDVSQSQARLALARSDARQALGDLESARATFRRIVGYDAPERLSNPPEPANLPATLEEAVTLARDANPIFEEARYLEKAAKSDVMVQAGTLLPSVSLQGTMDRSKSYSLLPATGRYNNDTLALNVSIPLYRSGADWSRLREARSQASRAKFNVLDSQNATVEDVTRTWQDYHTSKAVIISSEEGVKAAEVALGGVRQENQYGVRTILDVLNAEQEAFLSRVNVVKARFSERIHAYRLLAATGRLTARNLQLPVELENPKEHYNRVKYQPIGF